MSDVDIDISEEYGDHVCLSACGRLRYVVARCYDGLGEWVIWRYARRQNYERVVFHDECHIGQYFKRRDDAIAHAKHLIQQMKHEFVFEAMENG